MASVMKNDGKNDMADDAQARDLSQNPSEKKPKPLKSKLPPKIEVIKPVGKVERGGFFTIYKKGQGYWTRIGTVVAASLIALLTAQFLFVHGKIWFTVNNRANMPMVLGLVGAFMAVFVAMLYYIVNKPGVVDFLIATDSEMKKVNWTARAELIGSTKVVIIFMLVIALLLFILDTEFSQLLYYGNVLQFGVSAARPVGWWLMHCKGIELAVGIPLAVNAISAAIGGKAKWEKSWVAKGFDALTAAIRPVFAVCLAATAYFLVLAARSIFAHGGFSVFSGWLLRPEPGLMALAHTAVALGFVAVGVTLYRSRRERR